MAIARVNLPKVLCSLLIAEIQENFENKDGSGVIHALKTSPRIGLPHKFLGIPFLSR